MYIKMDDSEIRKIVSKNSEPEDSSQAMLDVWMGLSAPRPPTWRVLLEVLRANDKEELAVKIEQCRESEPNIFQEIPSPLFKEALKQKEKFEEIPAKKNPPKRSCVARTKLKKIIEEKDSEIMSSRRQVSHLETVSPAAPVPVAPKKGMALSFSGVVIIVIVYTTKFSE